MKSSTKSLIAVAVCLFLLAGAVLALQLSGNSTSSSSSGTASISLISKDSGDVQSMTVTNQYGSYTLLPVKSSTASSAASSGSSSGSDGIVYTVKELDGLPVNTSDTAGIAENGYNLTATKDIGTVSNSDDFGLKTPQATVKVTFTDGSTAGYSIGTTTATSSYNYYVQMDGSDDVYISSDINSEILGAAKDLVSTTILSVSEDSNSTYMFTGVNLSGSNFAAPVSLASDSSGNLVITAPRSYDMDSTEQSSLQTALTALTAKSIEAVNPDASALAAYGFNNPLAVAQYTVNDGTYKLTVGASNGSDAYYVMLGGVNVVYTVASDDIKVLAASDLYTLRSKVVMAPAVADVSGLQITVGSAANVINITRNESTSSSTSSTSYTYTAAGNNGASLDYSTNYKNFYSALSGITLLQNTDTMPQGTPAVKVVYSYFGRTDTDTVEYYLTSDRRYTAVVNGSVFGVVTQTDVDNVMDKLSQLENGQTVAS